jgi:outer membrane protein, multidrug efflux system
MLIWLIIGLCMAEPSTPLVETNGRDSSVGWWLSFDDSNLNHVINVGLSEGPDVLMAMARLKQSEAIAAQQGALLSPVLTASWSSNTQPRDALGFGFGLSDTSFGPPTTPSTEEEDEETERFTTGTAGLGLNIPIDLWGKAWTAYKAAQEDARAISQEQKATRLALSVSLANAYYDWALAVDNLEVTKGQIETSEDLLAITTLQHSRGEATSLDVLLQDQQVASSQRNLPVSEIQVETTRQRLLVMMGQPSTESLSLSPSLVALEEGGQHNSSDLMISHPDVVAAAHRVEAAKRRHASTGRDIFPTLSVGGSLSRQLNYSSETEEWDDIDTWAVTTGASMTLFQGGRKLQALRGTQAGIIQAEQSLRQTQLKATQELDSAIITEQSQSVLYQSALRQYTAAEQAFLEGKRQYEAGLVPVLTVLSTQTNFYQAQSLLLQVRRDRLTARLQLISALGGIWPPNTSNTAGADQ